MGPIGFLPPQGLLKEPVFEVPRDGRKEDFSCKVHCPSTKQKKDRDSEIADTIRDLKTSWKDPELSKKNLAMLQKQEERWAAEQFFWQQDYVLKQQEEARKQQEEAHQQLEEACKAREHIFNEWEKLQRNVRKLGLALETVSNPLLKPDMESDLVVMINKKNQLASMLNFN